MVRDAVHLARRLAVADRRTSTARACGRSSGTAVMTSGMRASRSAPRISRGSVDSLGSWIVMVASARNSATNPSTSSRRSTPCAYCSASDRSSCLIAARRSSPSPPPGQGETTTRRAHASGLLEVQIAVGVAEPAAVMVKNESTSSVLLSRDDEPPPSAEGSGRHRRRHVPGRGEHRSTGVPVHSSNGIASSGTTVSGSAASAAASSSASST